MNYHFFDYKYHIDYHAEDFDSPYRIIYMVFALVTSVLIAFLMRKASKQTIIRYLRCAAIAMIIYEIAKVSWESYWDITTGRGFNAGGILSLETCSMFMYVGIIAGFTKNEKVRRCCISWLATLGLVSGLSNVFAPQGLRWYPFWTFGAFHSMIYHYALVLTACILIFNRFYDFEFKDALRAFIPHAIFSAIVIPIDYIVGWNYMLYRDPSALPLISLITNKLCEKGLYWINTLIMLSLFFVLDFLFISLYIGVYKLIDWLKSKKLNRKQSNLSTV